MHPTLSQQQFSTLSATIQSAVTKESWKERFGYEWIVLFARIALFIGGLVIFYTDSIYLKCLALIVLSYAFYGIAITTTHETSHRSFAKSPTVNKLLAYFFSDFWGAQSNLWWYYRHVQEHHVYTNIPSVEEQSFSYPWLHKYLYFFVAPYAVTAWLIYRSVKFLAQQPKKLLLYLALMISGFLFHGLLFYPEVGLGWSVVCVLVMRSIFAPIFLHLAVFNHAGLDFLEQKIPWLPHQTRTTRNLRPHWIITGMGGNAFVDCHIEHHLFPRVSNHMLKKIRPLVTTELIKAGYNYKEEGYLTCLTFCLQHYQELSPQIKISDVV